MKKKDYFLIERPPDFFIMLSLENHFEKKLTSNGEAGKQRSVRDNKLRLQRVNYFSVGVYKILVIIGVIN